MPTVAVQGAQDLSCYQLEQKYKKKIRTAGNIWIFQSINHKEHQNRKHMRKLGKLAVAAVLIIAGTTLANKTLASAGAKMMGF